MVPNHVILYVSSVSDQVPHLLQLNQVAMVPNHVIIHVSAMSEPSSISFTIKSPFE